MKAIAITEPGNYNALKPLTVDKPNITNGNQLLIKLKAAGINPIDTKIRANPGAFPITLPMIPGFDGSGIVEAIGSDVTNFKVNDEVYFCQCSFHGQLGCYAEYCLVDCNVVAHKPKSIDFVAAAAVPLVLITAWEALFDRTDLKPDQTIFIPAGAGGVGHVAIQLAKQIGATVCTTVSSEQKSRYARQIGADLVIDYKNENVVERLINFTNNTGVDIAFDTIGGEVFQQCIACTKTYGEVVTILQPDNETEWSAARLKNLTIGLELMLTPALNNDPVGLRHHGEILKKCAELFDAGKLNTSIAKVFPLQEAGLAHQHLERSKPIGKVVLDIH